MWTMRRGSTADYERYMQRLADRFRTGEQADRLVRIVDQYMPRIAAENRVLVMRHPSQVAGMLKNAWKLRNKLRQKQKEKKRRSRPTTSTAPELREEDDGGATPSRATPARVTKASSDSEDTPPDWGGGAEPDDDVEGRPQGDDEPDDNMEGQPRGDEEHADDTQWPWGGHGRPSDRGG